MECIRTTVEQESQQVRASEIDSQKCCVDQDTPFDYPVREEVSEIPGRISIDLDGMYDIIISEKLSRAIRGECEFALVGSETFKKRTRIQADHCRWRMYNLTHIFLRKLC